MIFSSAAIYKIDPKINLVMDQDVITEKLSAAEFTPLGGQEEKRAGFYSPNSELFPEALAIRISEQNGIVIAIREDKKNIPASAVKQMLLERIESVERNQGYPVGRKQKKEMKEDLLSELMPKAFSSTTITPIILTSEYLIVGASSVAAADTAVSAVIRALGDLGLEFAFGSNLTQALTLWAEQNEVFNTDCLELGDFALLKQDKVSAQWKNDSAWQKQALEHIKKGKMVVKLGMSYSCPNGDSEPLGFVLNESGVIQQVTAEKNDDEGGSAPSAESKEDLYISNSAVTEIYMIKLAQAISEALEA